MDHRKTLDARSMGIMVLCCLTWGLQQVVLKAAAADISPLLQIALRSGVAAVLVALFSRWQGITLSLCDASWRAGLLVGFLFGLEFLLLGEGLRLTTASHAVVLLYTAPIFVALGLHWKLPSERLAAFQWFGILLAFGGIAISFLGRGQVDVALSADRLIGDILSLLAGIAWAATTLAVRLTRLSEASASKTLLYQLLGGFVFLLPAAIMLGQTGFKPTPLAWGSLLFQSLIVSFASYLAWFWLLRHYLASRLGVFSFLTPLFGIAFGVWLLDEPLEPVFLAGTALVLTGIVMVSGHGWLKAHRAG